MHFYGRQTNDIVMLMSLRAGGAHPIALNTLTGIITFPSFHTVIAIIFCDMCHRPPSHSFIPVAILNVLDAAVDSI